MNLPNFKSLPSDQEGRVGFILLWLMGVPIPVLFLFYLLRGCTCEAARCRNPPTPLSEVSELPFSRAAYRPLSPPPTNMS